MTPESSDPIAMLAAWKERYAGALGRLASMTDELKRSGSIDLAVLSVLLRELRSLA
jgi:NAD-specific glutamate dehydrogenase